MLSLARWFGQLLARYLTEERPSSRVGTPTNPLFLQATLQPGDVLLIEGSSRISSMIKYLTQSTWSHAALYVGSDLGGTSPGGEPYLFIEADLVEGVCKRPLSYYLKFHTRICRPHGLSVNDRERVLAQVIQKIGNRYDLKNIFDLARYLLPLPIPTRWRKTVLSFGSGDPTQAICSSLIAQAFQSVHYPVLPTVTREHVHNGQQCDLLDEVYHFRHESLYTPRDIDVSPYFEVIKPTLACGFDYRKLHWAKEIDKR